MEKKRNDSRKKSILEESYEIQREIHSHEMDNIELHELGYSQSSCVIHTRNTCRKIQSAEQ